MNPYQQAILWAADISDDGEGYQIPSAAINAVLFLYSLQQKGINPIKGGTESGKGIRPL